MKRTNSFEVDEANSQKATEIKIQNKRESQDQIIIGVDENHQEQKKQYVEDIVFKYKKEGNQGRNEKLPNSIKQSIRKNATGKKMQESLTTSKITRAILERMRKMTKKFVCQICVCQYEQIEKQKIGNCQHVFCNSCIQQYVEYKITRFQEVVCPQQFCPLVIDTEGQFYKGLPNKLQTKHSKIRAFYLAEKTNSRLCPDEKCVDGIIYTKEGSLPKCDKCKKVYCPKCFFPQHEGPCQKNEIEFFENNFKFRQCNSCKSVVEKTAGCNHITCKCKYEFCYLCGGAWNRGNHKCVNPQQLEQQRIEEERIRRQTQAQVERIRRQTQAQVERIRRQTQAQVERIRRQTQARRLYQQTCQYKCKLFTKIFLVSPIFFIIIILMFSMMIVGFFLAVIALIIIGYFGYSVDLICKERSKIFMIIEIVFFPILGLGAILEAFFQLLPQALQMVCGTPYRWLIQLKRLLYEW